MRPGTNVVIPGANRGSGTLWLDHSETNPSRRFKFVTPSGGDNENQVLRFSADGVHWSAPAPGSGVTGDRSTVFFNPFRQVWAYSIKTRIDGARARAYRESPDLIAGATWRKDEPVLWARADMLDLPRTDLGTAPQPSNLDAAPYESLHWDRANRSPFLVPSEQQGDWNWGNVQSPGGGPMVVGDNLDFYVSGRGGAGNGGSQSGVRGTRVCRYRAATRQCRASDGKGPAIAVNWPGARCVFAFT